MRYFLLAIVVLLTSTLSYPAVAEVKPGDVAPDFQLQSSVGKTHSLSEYKGKWVVLEWTNYECPFVRKFYGSRKMQELQKTYTGKGVVWLQINSSASGKQGDFTPAEIVRRSGEWKTASTAYLIDEDGKVGRMYDARTTPTIVIISPEGKIVYHGAIDSIPSTDTDDISKADNYVEKTFSEVFAGKPVKVATTRSYGCGIKY